MPDEIEVLDSGAMQSRLEERCDLLPPHGVLRVAQVLAEGASKYGEWNWMGIPVQSHINHAARHILKYIGGDTHEDHLAHAACRLLMALDLHLVGRGKVGERIIKVDHL